ncbi:acetolactate decarboxylase [Polynucleobacter antarcticus]|uniref:Alpha-acetolactate decarboxylase n=1 Tax=Polynucleobacter antarcticus TaxID=1743162 RepID=A0A6M9PP41_9BURK|nr:acetolactate decarboxylase [Polynucleobacter antarcticus]QKM62171.1 acetolactate decarboxylase [Polynucleobacter antarcticus]
MPTSLYISSPVNALVEGIFREDKTIQDLLNHGNFGIGTINDFDGEMILLDSISYQIHGDGAVTVNTPDTLTPYACVTQFYPTQEHILVGENSYDNFLKILSNMLISKNLIFAICVHGKFTYLKTRSVEKQSAYKTLLDVTHGQQEFEFTDISGTLVGFWTPNFMHSVTVPGFHLHFISDDKKSGGHLLHCRTEKVSIQIQAIDSVVMDLPHTPEYLEADLNRDPGEDLAKAEH